MSKFNSCRSHSGHTSGVVAKHHTLSFWSSEQAWISLEWSFAVHITRWPCYCIILVLWMEPSATTADCDLESMACPTVTECDKWSQFSNKFGNYSQRKSRQKCVLLQIHLQNTVHKTWNFGHRPACRLSIIGPIVPVSRLSFASVYSTICTKSVIAYKNSYK